MRTGATTVTATAPTLVALVAWATPASPSADTHVIEANDIVPGHPGVTYLSLIKQAVPGLAQNDADHQIEGHLDVPPRHLAGKSDEGDPPDPVVLGFIDDQRIRAGGKPRIVLMADLGPDPDRAQSMTLLLLLDDAPAPRLLDVVDVGVDKDTSFDDQPKPPLAPGDDALITYSEHFNSDQTYSGRLIAFVRHDRFQLIDDIFTLSDRGCGWQRDETPSFTTHPGHPYAAIDVVVREQRNRNGEDCADEAVPKPYAHRYESICRWNAGKGAWTARPDGLSRLAALNKKRF